MNIKHILYTVRPLSQEEIIRLNNASGYLSERDASRLNMLVKRKQCKINMKRAPYSRTITSAPEYPVCVLLDEDAREDVFEISEKIKHGFQEKLIKTFRTNAFQKTVELLAPKIIGFSNVKEATALQLFSEEPYHVLLLGDPGTGKTDILRAIENLSPIAAFGLGSGTSNTGLTVTITGNEIKKGILSLADGGMAIIDELNLMKKEDRAGLYNAMEKGFISYDKGGHRYKFPAKCSVLASANPKKDTIIGNDIYSIKKQLPFDPALLSRFHLVFLVRKQGKEEFMDIADEVLLETHKNISKEDESFMKSYVEGARKINVAFPERFNEHIKDFILKVRSQEKNMLFDITPRFIIGLKRLMVASAKCEMRNRVEEKDVERVLKIYTTALKEVGLAKI